MRLSRIAPWLPAVLLAQAAAQAQAEDDPWALTFYGARVSGEKTWQHIIQDPLNPSFVDAYLLSGALSRSYTTYKGGALVLEAEGQVVYNFGDQSHWEFNVVPVVARWRRFPWSRTVSTSAAFGVGLSYATEIPEVELALEDTSHQSMVYWVLELTAGPPAGSWAFSLRLHHRSDAWGLMGSDGGVNAIGFGLRHQF